MNMLYTDELLKLLVRLTLESIQVLKTIDLQFCLNLRKLLKIPALFQNLKTLKL